MGRFLDPLRVDVLPDGRWLLLERFRYSEPALGSLIEVPQGYLTDAASLPAWTLPFFGKRGPWDHAAVLHDWLYDQVIKGELERVQADACFKSAMHSLRVKAWQQWLIYLSVRLAGRIHIWWTQRKNKKLMKTLVLTAALVALVFAAGCKTTPPPSEVAKAAAPNALTAEQLDAIFQNERARGAISDERDAPGRSISSSIKARINPDTEQRGLVDFDHQIDVYSGFQTEGLTDVEMLLNQNRELVANGDERLSVPVGFEFRAGQYAKSSNDNIAAIIAANAQRETGRAAGAAEYARVSYEGLARVIDAEGKAREAYVTAKFGGIVKVIQTLADGTKVVGQVVAQFFPVPAAANVIQTVIARDGKAYELADPALPAGTVIP